jgi:ribose transport system permease protein
MSSILTGTSLGDYARRNSAILVSYLLVLGLVVVGTVHSPDFGTYDNLRNIAVLASFVGVAGLGQTMCILTGGIDLSVPSVLTGSAVLAAIVANGHASRLPLAILLVVGIAVGVGLFNGIGVAYAGVPPIIMTLGANGALQGLLLVYTNGGFSSAPPQALLNFVTGSVLGFSNDLLVWLLVIVIGVTLLTWTTFGRHLYAIGTNRTAAYLAGTPVRPILVVPYIVSAVGAAVAGLLLMGYTGTAYLNMGDPYLFTSAVAVAVGGASILGGQGHYLGTVAGALILTLVSAILPLFGLSLADITISYGVVLLVAVFISSFRLSRR